MEILEQLDPIFNYDMLHIGGGNAKHLKEPLPPRIRVFDNVEGHDRRHPALARHVSSDDPMIGPLTDEREWLEADRLGGFATGAASGIRARRYHALLTAARRRGLDHIEDLASPGIFRFAVGDGAPTAAIVLRAGRAPYGDAGGIADNVRAIERTRRARFADPMRRAADTYLVRRGDGLTVIADGEAPHAPRGAPFQAWSLAELLRMRHLVDDVA